MTKTSELFHPLIWKWFTEEIGSPTEVQRLAWPKISIGEHLLITAPTGSGKTLTAFLWALDRLIGGKWPNEGTRVLYVSPLKALNNDIQRNLIVPLTELQTRFERAGEPFPDIRVMTRSGDTDPSDRTRMFRHPPEILITTPESLNLLVGSKRGRAILTDLKTVILDEIHSVAGSKRGTHLITAVDRLVFLSGEFQRIALSATVRPLERIASWIGGRRMEERGEEIVYRPRDVGVVDCRLEKKIQLNIRFPNPAERSGDDSTVWTPLVADIKKIVRRNRSTLIFTNNRRESERISFMLNEGEDRRIAYAHHGSLSRETRSLVEKRLKNGELAAIAATSSLELGIDIGALDEVVLVKAPPGIAAALQRVGRAGHGVGQTSKGTVFPIHGRDLLDAAVICKSVLQRDIEEIHPIECPLDVLAQIVTSMCAVEEWSVDGLYVALRASSPYADLRRDDYDRVLGMLSGRYSNKRMRHIRPLISIDRIDGVIRAKDGALQKVCMEGGTIPDRGYFALRHRDTRSKIGELDEEFVWERRLGDTFMLGTQVWKIHQITHNDVFAFPTDEPARIAPFWRNEQINRDFYCSEQIGLFLEKANRDVKRKAFRQSLLDAYAMDENAADALIDFLKRQKELSRCDLPHRRHLAIEYTRIPSGKNAGAKNSVAGTDWRQVILHTGWGGRVNQPLALILAAAWEEKGGGRLETIANNDGVLLSLTDDLSLSELLLSIRPGDLEKWLRKKLESSGFFGARFRENASRALLLTKGRFGQRTPLWLHRLRSKELLDAIERFDDFPILLETWRTCLRDEFDLESLQRVLSELQTGEMQVTEFHTPVPSPFAESLVWIQTNVLVYIGDASFSDRQSALRDDLIREVAGSADLRPEIASDLIGRLEERLQRRAFGYAPDSERDLLDWIKERLFVPVPEWELLCKSIQTNSDVDLDDLLLSLSDKIVTIALPKTSSSGVVALECVPRLLTALEVSHGDATVSSIVADDALDIDWDRLLKNLQGDLAFVEDSTLDACLGQWLAFYGPVSHDFVIETLGVDGPALNEAIETLTEDERVICGLLRKGSEREEICDRENFERLLRWMRREAAPSFSPLPAENIPLYLARHQGFTRRGESVEELQQILEPLLGYAAPAEQWEKEFIPARMKAYQLSWLDELTRDSDFLWYGCGKQVVTLCFRDQIDLLQSGESRENEETSIEMSAMFPDRRGKYDFSQLLESTNLSSSQLTEELWSAVWKGMAGNDAFSALRKGVDTKFKAYEIPETRPRGRSGFGRWKSSRPFSGNWFALEPPIPAEDSLEALERSKDCVRLLLDRYGILFRELLQKELPSLRWGVLFKAMRIMELSGELVGGYFFEGVAGVQFVRTSALRTLLEKFPEDAVYWLNAADPASLCGLSIEGMKGELPPRRPSNHLVYHGKKLVMVSVRQGKELDVRVDADCPNLSAYFGLFNDWLNRPFQPAKSITVETINKKAAADSPYLPPLRDRFAVVVDYKKIELRKRY